MSGAKSAEKSGAKLPHPIHYNLRGGDFLGQIADDGSGPAKQAVTLFVDLGRARKFSEGIGGTIFTVRTVAELDRLCATLASAGFTDFCLDPDAPDMLYAPLEELLAWGRRSESREKPGEERGSRKLREPVGIALDAQDVPLFEVTAAPLGRVCLIFRTPGYAQRWLSLRTPGKLAASRLAGLTTVADCERFCAEWAGYFAAYTLDPPVSARAGLVTYPLERLVELARAQDREAART